MTEQQLRSAVAEYDERNGLRIALNDARSGLAVAIAERDETIRQLRAGLERLARLYEDDQELCERPMWLQELIARPARNGDA